MRLGKADVQLTGLLGQRYGTVFEVQGKQLVATAYAELYEDIVIGDCAWCLFNWLMSCISFIASQWFDSLVSDVGYISHGLYSNIHL